MAAVIRHGLIYGLVVAILLAAQAFVPTATSEAKDLGAGPFPLLKVLAPALADASPAALRTLNVLMLLGAAALVQIGAYRLTGNRPVAGSAAIFAVANPAATALAAHPEGCRDILAFGFAAGLVLGHAKPRFRSPRFPNRRPSAFTWPVFLLLVVGALSAPGVWAMPPLLVLLDLAFDRERGGLAYERNWRSYLPYAVVFAAGAAATLIFRPAVVAPRLAAELAATFWRRPLAMLAPRLADGLPGFCVAIVWTLLGLGVLIFALDLLTNIGSRRHVVKYVGFGSAWIVLALMIVAVFPDGSTSKGTLTGGIAVGLVLAALLWRLFAAARPELASAAQRALDWESLRRGADLTPLPSLSGVAPPRRLILTLPDRAPVPPEAEPRIEGSDEALAPAVGPRLRDALERIAARRGVEARNITQSAATESGVWSRIFIDRLLSKVGRAEHVVEIVRERSLLTAVIAARVRGLTVVALGPAARRRSAEILRGLDGASVVEAPSGRLPFADRSLNFVVAPGRSIEQSGSVTPVTIEEISRVMARGGRAVLGFDAAPGGSADSLREEARLRLRSAGMRILETIDDGRGDAFCVVAEPVHGDADADD